METRSAAINLPVEQALAKFAKIYADNSKFRQRLPRNARDIKTAEQAEFLKEHHGRPGFTEKAFCLHGADFQQALMRVELQGQMESQKSPERSLQ